MTPAFSLKADLESEEHVRESRTNTRRSKLKKITVIVETEKDPNGVEKPVSVIVPDGRYYQVEKTMHYAVSPEEYEGMSTTEISDLVKARVQAHLDLYQK